jgi:RNA polymerase sigma factor (sigma-70 family)
LLSFFQRLTPEPAPGAGDAELLSRYLGGDGDAFAALASRYAPLVWGACRRLLADYHEAEDAFQAVFVVLARKAPSLGGGPLGPWLYKVARDAALQAKRCSARRGASQVRPRCEPAAHDAPELERRERDAALDEELGRLPERLRRPLVLCYLEGLTNEEAARRLGCPKGTVLSRLSRARERLRQRLARRGIDLSPGVLPAVAAAPARAALVEAAGRVGRLVFAGETAGLSPSVGSLARGVMFDMFLRKLKAVGLVLLLVGLTAAGAGWLGSLAAGPAARGVPLAAGAGVPWMLLRGDAAGTEGAEKPAPGRLIYRVATDLQRELVQRPADLFILLDATEAVSDGKVSPEGLKLEDLHKDLLKHKKAGGKIYFHLFFKRTRTDDSRAHVLLRYTVIGLGHSAGFSQVDAGGVHPNSDIPWGDFIKKFRGKRGRRGEPPEPATGNRLVRGYPVRTELSRYLTSGADCAVVVLPSLGKEGGAIPKEVRQATRDLLGKLKLARKGKISFHLSHVDNRIQGPLCDEFSRFADTLGFETSSVSFR